MPRSNEDCVLYLVTNSVRIAENELSSIIFDVKKKGFLFFLAKETFFIILRFLTFSLMESNCVAITNLNIHTYVDDIYNSFHKFGEVLECRLLLNERNESKGSCFITYKNHRDAITAISEMNGTRFDGKEIKVEWAMGRKKTEDDVV